MDLQPGKPLTTTSNETSYGPALATLTTLFFMWGFMTVMNDVLIPHLKDIFKLSYFQSMLIQTAFFGAYFVGSLIYYLISNASGDPINKIGYKNGILIGLGVSALGSALFYPATLVNVYSLYLVALFVLGFGFTMLQIAANPYVAILGKPETASSRLNLAQGFNSLGTTLGPLIGGYLIFTYFEGSEAVQIPYLVFAGLLVLLALLIHFSKLPAFTNDDPIEKGASALNYPHLVMGMLAIFFYVGGEVAVGSVLINFFGLEEIAGLTEDTGTTFLSLYWGGLMIGRFSGAIYLSDISAQSKKIGYMVLMALGAFGVIWLANYLKVKVSLGEIIPLMIFVALAFGLFIMGRSLPARTLQLFAGMIILLLLVTMFTTGNIAFWAVIGVGIFNSIMWSNIFTLAIDGLGKSTSQGSSLLVMMILGGAIIPPLQGLVADSSLGLQMSFIVPLLCYVYLFYYGSSGYKLGRDKKAA
ncbi:MAG: sugar MFS transporter [Bacteroidota bacterium]